MSRNCTSDLSLPCLARPPAGAGESVARARGTSMHARLRYDKINELPCSSLHAWAPRCFSPLVCYWCRPRCAAGRCTCNRKSAVVPASSRAANTHILERLHLTNAARLVVPLAQGADSSGASRGFSTLHFFCLGQCIRSRSHRDLRGRAPSGPDQLNAYQLY